jgi:hypothetical protein
VYTRASELSDEPPGCIVLTRDPDIDSELCFVEHPEAIVVSIMDLCHTEDITSLQISRGAQHSSLVPARSHDVLEGLNRRIPTKQNVNKLAILTVECRNCNLDIHV